MSQATSTKSEARLSCRRAQFSIEAVFYLLALATIILFFTHLFSSTSARIQNRQIIPSMRLAGDLGDMLVLNPEQGYAVRQGPRARSHLCENVQNFGLSNDTTYCVTRACSVKGQMELFKVCA